MWSYANFFLLFKSPYLLFNLSHKSIACLILLPEKRLSFLSVCLLLHCSQRVHFSVCCGAGAVLFELWVVVRSNCAVLHSAVSSQSLGGIKESSYRNESKGLLCGPPFVCPPHFFFSSSSLRDKKPSAHRQRTQPSPALHLSLPPRGKNIWELSICHLSLQT